MEGPWSGYIVHSRTWIHLHVRLPRHQQPVEVAELRQADAVYVRQQQALSTPQPRLAAAYGLQASQSDQLYEAV